MLLGYPFFDGLMLELSVEDGMTKSLGWTRLLDLKW